MSKDLKELLEELEKSFTEMSNELENKFPSRKADVLGYDYQKGLIGGYRTVYLYAKQKYASS